MSSPITTILQRLLPDRRNYTRVTTTHSFIPEIDGLRFLAIAAVFLCHLPNTLLKHNGTSYTISDLEKLTFNVMGFGGYGVQLFFMISGFILALPFARAHLGGSGPVSIKKYLLRRLTRLELPYVVNLLICAGLLYIGNKYDIATIGSHLLASIGYSHNWLFHEHSLINRVAWSLEIEIQFYLLAPWLALVFRLPRHFRRGLLLVSIAGLSVLTRFIPAEPQLLVQQLHFFLAGFLLAELYLAGSLRRSLPCIATTASLLIILAYLSGPSSLGRALVLPWAFLALGIAGFRSTSLRPWLSRPWIATIGGMCYTVYLYHGVIISAVVQKLFRATHLTGYAAGDIVLLAGITLPFTAIVSLLAFRWIERPCMQPSWPSQLWQKFLSVLPQPNLTGGSSMPPRTMIS